MDITVHRKTQVFDRYWKPLHSSLISEYEPTIVLLGLQSNNLNQYAGHALLSLQ